MSKGNLLIIDDEELLAQNISFLLKSHAEKIFTANNGLEALPILQQEKIHCVICDIAMPKMNGVELIKNVRAGGSQIPFIFYTAYLQSELMMEAAKYGAFDFLSKPDFDGLEEVVSRGLKEGFTRKTDSDVKQEMLSEYEKILQMMTEIEGEEK
jgi:two-component system nitrogen regulation response regulator NtrX